MRILLTEQDFDTLVRGKVLEINGVEIALQDIGYSRILEVIQDKKHTLENPSNGREQQAWILKNLIAGNNFHIFYGLADNITRSDYADHLWPEWSLVFRAHFMFHTPKDNNGFADGKRTDTPHSFFNHCCYCSSSRSCSEFRISDAVKAHEYRQA